MLESSLISERVMTSRGISPSRSGLISSNRPATQQSRRANVVIFPYHRDRLACDPQNFLCVYENYEFKWSDTIEEAERSVHALIDAMILSTRRAFDASMTYWQQLPLSVRRALALRGVSGLPNCTSMGLLVSIPPAGGADATLTPRAPRKSAVHISRSSMDPSNSNTAHSAQLSHRRRRSSALCASFHRAVPRSAQRERREEETLLNDLVQQWEAPHNGPRCRLVLDIVASRKTLGVDPLQSAPYRLGQSVFRYVQARYPAQVVHAFVGISDTAVVLVGRDMVFPYRATSGGGAIGSPRGHTPHAPMGLAAAAAAALSLQGGGAGTAGLEQLLGNVIPPPRMVTAPPVNTDKVDNMRLLVCYPPPGDDM